MPIARQNESYEPVVIEGSFRIEVDPADADPAADIAAVTADAIESLKVAADAVTAAALRVGASGRVRIDGPAGNSVCYDAIKEAES